MEHCLSPQNAKFPALGVSTSGFSLRGAYRTFLARSLHFLENSSRSFLCTVCFILVAFVGLGDYVTGYERSFLVFYLVPVALGTWMLGRNFGLALSIFAVAVSVVSDLAGGVPEVLLWNAVMRLASYVIFTWQLAHARSLLRHLDQRVRERTAALQHEIACRRELEKEIAETSERERRRLGQDLHDTLCQHLTGTALVAHVLSESLAAKSQEEAAQAAKVVRLVEEGVDMTRNLARGFFSPDLEAEGLQVALQGLAQNTQECCAVRCVFVCDAPAPVRDSTTATQLYRIAQEAVTNAIKHSQAQRITIALRAATPTPTLTITDDGIGFPDHVNDHSGLGLRIMAHSASLIGAELAVGRNKGGGTVVYCAVRSLIGKPEEER
jgi:signal transduction histidine kinase